MSRSDRRCPPFESLTSVSESRVPGEKATGLAETPPCPGERVFVKAAGDGSKRLLIRAFEAGCGLVIVLTGGDEPHIGAVAIAIPRPSLADPTVTSSTTSVYAVVGHKDDEIAKPMAEKAARELNRVVVAIAGVHVHGTTTGIIAEITRTASELLEDVVGAFGGGAAGAATTPDG